MKLQNRAMLQFRLLGTWGESQASPYMGFSAERGSWARRSRDASCSTKATQSPAEPGQLCKLGRSCQTCFTHPSLGLGTDEVHTHSCRCPTMSLCINIFVYMCPDLSLFSHYLHRCGCGHIRTPWRFCVHALTARLLVQTSVYSLCRCSIFQRDAHL